MTTPEHEKFEKWWQENKWGEMTLTGVGLKCAALDAWQAALSAAPTPNVLLTDEMKTAFKAAYKDGSIWTDRLSHALEAMMAVAPTPPEVEPVGVVRRFMLETLHRRAEMTDVSLNAKGKSLPDGTKLYTYPPSPKAEYDAAGEPLNLMAAAENVFHGKFLNGSVITGELAKRLGDLRKFIEEGS